jgi:hypothetical protein
MAMRHIGWTFTLLGEGPGRSCGVVELELHSRPSTTAPQTFKSPNTNRTLATKHRDLWGFSLLLSFVQNGMTQTGSTVAISSPIVTQDTHR